MRTGERVHWNIGAGSLGVISGTHALLGGALSLAGGVLSLYWSWRAWRKSRQSASSVPVFPPVVAQLRILLSSDE